MEPRVKRMKTVVEIREDSLGEEAPKSPPMVDLERVQPVGETQEQEEHEEPVEEIQELDDPDKQSKWDTVSQFSNMLTIAHSWIALLNGRQMSDVSNRMLGPLSIEVEEFTISGTQALSLCEQKDDEEVLALTEGPIKEFARLKMLIQKLLLDDVEMNAD